MGICSNKQKKKIPLYEIWKINESDPQYTPAFITIVPDKINRSLFNSSNVYLINENRVRLWLWIGRSATLKTHSNIWEIKRHQKRHFKLRRASISIVYELIPHSAFDEICLPVSK